jgi:subtilisin family serine protease
MPNDIDPRLPTLEQQPSVGLFGFAKSIFAPSEPSTVNVHVKLSDVGRFRRRPGVEVRSVAGPDPEGNWLATASVPADRLNGVLNGEEVIAAEAPSRLRPQLTWAVPNMAARPQDFPQALGNGGSGVVVGIIDSDGLDYRLPSFRNGNTSRISFVRSLDGNHEFSRAQIEQSLPSGTLLPNYPLDPSTANKDRVDSHGTAVTDCAAGSNPAGPGAAPNAEIVYVELANKFRWKQVTETFCQSTELVDAVDYIFGKAGQKPCVINISQGTMEGPANGLSLASQHFEVLLAAQPNRAIVISAGNYGDDLFHAALRVGPGETRTAAFRIWPRLESTKPRGWHELNAWYAPQGAIAFRLVGPSNTYGPFPLGAGTKTISENGKVILEWAHLERPALQQRQLYVGIADAAADGIWRLEVTGSGAAAAPVEDVHLYLIGGDNASDPWFDGDSATRSQTLVSLACSPQIIAVGAHDGVPGGADRTAIFSSIGPTRANVQKPDLTGPGISIKMAQTGGKFARGQGTSYASPLVAGVAALCLPEAKARNGSLSAAELRQILIDTATQEANPRTWDPRRGWGRVNAAAALREIATRFPSS